MPLGRASLSLVVVLALGAVGVLGWLLLGEPPSASDVADDTARRPPEAPAPAGVALTAASREPAPTPTEGVDPSTGEVARAEVRFVTEDGRPAAGARAAYRPVNGQDAPLRGTADAQGRMPLHAAVVGQRVLLDVEAGAGWGRERLDLWAVGSARVVLGSGCQVWLVLPAADLDLVGSVCHFLVDGREEQATLGAQRALLGTFRASRLQVSDVGGWPYHTASGGLLLPRSGSVEVAWKGRGERRTPVRFRSYGAAAEVPRVLLTPDGGGLDARIAPSATGPDSVEYALWEGPRFLYLVASAGHWSLGRVDLKPPAPTTTYPQAWAKGCRLEVLLPEPGPALWARAYVASEPERSLRAPPTGSELVEAQAGEPVELVPHTRLLQDPSTDWIDFGAELVAPACREWPVEPDVTRSRVVWSCVPTGRVLRIVVAGTRLGTLSQNVFVPADAERHEVRLAPTTAFTVEVEGARTTLPGEEEWLSVACGDGRKACCTVFLPREQSRVVVRGFPLGQEATVTVRGGGVAGEATARVTGDMRLAVVTRALPLARYRVRVVGPAGAPLEGVGVSWSAPGWETAVTRTDAAGIAARMLEVGAPVTAQVDDPRYRSPEATVRSGSLVDLAASLPRTLRLELDLGVRRIDVSLTEERSDAREYDAVPGSVLVADVESEREAHVRVSDAASDALLFERRVVLAEGGPTTVRVTR